jgi:Uma2 family endonuclease
LHGTKEYWIIDPTKQTVEQYLLMQPNDTSYFEPFKFVRGDEVSSKVIYGFTIPVDAIFDETANMVALRELMR